ncbi:hypothetical protein HMPREF0868_0805 [Mageeibacillus indolicus UPII9-5]|uniref:Uncharacterized protein n=1 Tax=Mageeibacillus indolicus (strain UPII9-5) TaxID=699246 RepID=D3R1R4_MAGIU|nr:hypothetical protein HMPREF0868_0805 [Mageeibacillus indolicus UPII9-5]
MSFQQIILLLGCIDSCIYAAVSPYTKSFLIFLKQKSRCPDQKSTTK